jgi:hypothetical protein
VFRGDTGQGVAPDKRSEAIPFAFLVDLRVKSFGEVGGLDRGPWFLLSRRGVGICGAQGEDSGEYYYNTQGPATGGWVDN